jgi:hypothetical protein
MRRCYDEQFMTCPKCGKTRAHRSHRSFGERTLSWFGLKPYRCKDCQHRFFAYRGGEGSEKLRSPEERRILKLRRQIKWKRTKGELILYGVGTVLMLWLIYYLVNQMPAPPAE